MPNFIEIGPVVWISIPDIHTPIDFHILDLTYSIETKISSTISSNIKPGNTKLGSITVQLTSCLTGLESAV